VFNPKDLSHLKYHIYAIIFGLVSSLISIVIEDIGITVSMNTAKYFNSVLKVVAQLEALYWSSYMFTF